MKHTLAVLLVLAFVPSPVFGEEQLVVPPFSLAKLSVPSAAADVSWSIEPSDKVSIADTSPNRLQFTAPPGKYLVSVRYVYDGVRYSGRLVVVFQDVGKDAPEPKPKEKIDSWESISRIRFGSSFCSAVLLPALNAPCYYALTAAHCISHVGQEGRFSLRDGGTVYRAVVAAANRTSDWAILIIPDLRPDAESASGVRVAKLSQGPYQPKINELVWHGGFGVDKPGNREEGRFVGGPDSSGQYQYILSVSPGDSGGGIFSSEDYLLSPVCCTTAPSRVGRVWGAAPQSWYPAFLKFAQATTVDKQMPVKPEQDPGEKGGDKNDGCPHAKSAKERAREFTKHIIALHVVDLVRARQPDESTKPITTKDVLESMGNKYDAMIDMLLEDLEVDSSPNKLLEFIERHKDSIVRIAKLILEIILKVG